MGDKVNAIIRHELLAIELLDLPNRFNDNEICSPIKKDESYEEWKWTRENIDALFLKDYWDRSWRWYTKNKWSEEDLAMITGPDYFNLHSYFPKTISISNWINWHQFKENDELNLYFKGVILWLSKFIDAQEIILTSDQSIDQLDEREYEYNELIDSLKKHDLEFEVMKNTR
ncbi:hypothetical protein LVD15_00210 [Fulvivirga maritima]|uniref:hypothetical protein n=1 Tax=Fulvivirga maritima TaxID=2904247 RepID=UPI001F378479|nr:hypothetical protein [Fulvivirga maritima]UII26894.1 hypothetical protein LVD15_00210 [Fulvivirga maritima]